ncbi:hypothetical protein DFR70_103461 [Nocardia tenerifensis]|uniref:Uncharacterized protein n=1 Tax=Nocardia tenerifensis TaxID=228006 RepID=A0A318K4D5_9NOCA|nr:hypothetical protein [Nocardia tenerifensis]PXX66711.1 hypothetical protein DFR70_103461 [Nocardia tenerifensis]
MNDLLATAITAHGGLERWNRIKTIRVDAAIGGAFWQMKGKADAMSDVRFEVDTTRQQLTMDYRTQDRRSLFQPDRVVLQQLDGTVVDAREDPERSFAGHQLQTPWDDLHLAYFTGEALWTYVNTPFLFTWPGFVCDEIAPIEAHGETWRRLSVTFPDHIKSHTREQVFCFGPDGLLRRHDFTIDIVDPTTESQLYATDYRDVDGIIIPAARRADITMGDERIALVTIDMTDILVSEDALSTTQEADHAHCD